MNKNIKESLTKTQRTLPLSLYIDPGFVHHRKIETILGQSGINLINGSISKIPSHVPNWQKATQIDHIYTRIFLKWAAHVNIKTLLEVLSDKCGTCILSAIAVKGCVGNIYKDERVYNEVVLGNTDSNVIIEYSTKKVTGDTLRSYLSNGHDSIAIIGELFKFDKENNTLVFHPMIMGFPWLEGEADFSPEWFSSEFYQVFVEDIDELSKAEDIEVNGDEWHIMGKISENGFKRCLAEILNESAKRDWGGETSDHYSTHLHLNGRRVSGAFLLKGPAKFQPMTLNNLGKNNDQINRLAKEPANLLVVQHCHDIEPVVHETLRAFAVQPGNPRYYCMIDGKDSYRLLKAYNKIETALEYSKKS